MHLVIRQTLHSRVDEIHRATQVNAAAKRDARQGTLVSLWNATPHQVLQQFQIRASETATTAKLCESIPQEAANPVVYGFRLQLPTAAQQCKISEHPKTENSLKYTFFAQDENKKANFKDPYSILNPVENYYGQSTVLIPYFVFSLSVFLLAEEHFFYDPTRGKTKL